MPAQILAEIAFYPPFMGGRIVMPKGDGYSPYLRSNLISADVPIRVNGVPPDAKFSDSILVTLELMYYPQQDYGALADGVAIQLLEGPKIVAEGTCRSDIIAA